MNDEPVSAVDETVPQIWERSGGHFGGRIVHPARTLVVHLHLQGKIWRARIWVRSCLMQK